MIDVNIFLAFTGADKELKELAAKKITTWNNTHTYLGYNFRPYDWLTDATPEANSEAKDGQFFINRQLIDKCELLFAFIINGTGTPYIHEEKKYPCATLYEVDYHRNNGKRACIFLNDDTVRKEHSQFIRDDGMGLFLDCNNAKFKEIIYEKIDQILMEYIDTQPKITQEAQKVILKAHEYGKEFFVITFHDIDKMYFLDVRRQQRFLSCSITDGEEVINCLCKMQYIQKTESPALSQNEIMQTIHSLGLCLLVQLLRLYHFPLNNKNEVYEITEAGIRYVQRHLCK